MEELERMIGFAATMRLSSLGARIVRLRMESKVVMQLPNAARNVNSGRSGKPSNEDNLLFDSDNLTI